MTALTNAPIPKTRHRERVPVNRVWVLSSQLEKCANGEGNATHRVRTRDSPFAESRERECREMFGVIGLPGRGSTETVAVAGVNQRGASVRREIVWLPKTDTDPNSRLENLGEGTFSRLLTRFGISEMCPIPAGRQPVCHVTVWWMGTRLAEVPRRRPLAECPRRSGSPVLYWCELVVTMLLASL